MSLTIGDLLKQLIDVEPTTSVKNKFYVKFNPETAQILSVDAVSSGDAGTHNIEISEELGIKFLTAEEDITKWMISNENGQLVFKKKPTDKIEPVDRVSLNPIVQVKIHSRMTATRAKEEVLHQASEEHRLKKIKDEPYFFPKNYWNDLAIANRQSEGIDVEITLVKKLGKILINYNPSIVQTHSDILKFFFTREDDPTHLKGMLHLSEDTLSRVMEQNGLEEWPRSFYISIPGGIDDLSIYMLKSELIVFASEK